MKLSTETLEILNNFYTINESIVFNPGNRIRTMGTNRTFLAEAIVPEVFEKEFGIYNLKTFLDAYNIVGDPELIFDNDEYVILKNGSSEIKYYFSEISLIEAPPKDKNFVIPSSDVCFVLENYYLAKMLKMATFDSDRTTWAVEFNGNGKDIAVHIFNIKDPTKPSYSFVVGKTDNEFSSKTTLDKIKFISGNYEVIISKARVSKFKHANRDLSYYIPMSPESTFVE